MTDLRDRSAAEPWPTRDDYTAAVAAAREAAQAYYAGGESGMDDATYDRLVARIAATEAAHPDWTDSGELLTAVAAGTAGTTTDADEVVHATPMLSLDNAFAADVLRQFLADAQAEVGRPVAWLVEPKMDGIAISASYVDGRLVRVATRGDGRVGEDVTAGAGAVDGLPVRLSSPLTVEVRGEMILTDADLAAANELRDAHDDKPFANARNAVAGILRAKHRTYDLPLSFGCYDVVGVDGGTVLPDAYHQRLELIEAAGVRTALDRLAVDTRTGVDGIGSHASLMVGAGVPVDDVDEVVHRVELLGQARDAIPFGIDGAVVKADTMADRDELGSGSRAPKWAIAYKYPAIERITVLQAITLQVGRTGVVTPVAELEPVEVAGTTVTRATLSNPLEAVRKDVRVGEKVWVRRAGDVIPEVLGPVDPDADGRPAPWQPPTACPRCDAELDTSQRRWRCPNRTCGAVEGIRYAVSRKCLDVDGAGPALIEALVAAGRLTDHADLFTLSRDDIATLEGWGATSADKLLAELDRARARPLSRQLVALGLRTCGTRLSERIAAHLHTLEAVRAATVDRLCEVEGIGPERAAIILADLADAAEVLDKLVAAGVETTEPTVQVADDAPLAGKKVCVTGTLPTLSRSQAQAAVKQLGGTVASSVSKATDLLVAGDKAGSKLAKAETLGVEVMDGATFEQLADGHAG